MSEMLDNNRRMMFYLVVSNFLLYLGFQVWRTMFNNYAVEQIGVGPASIGLIQALRELPGLMGFLLGFLALFLNEVRIMALSVVLLGVGVLLTGQANSVPMLVFSTLVMSMGFHFFYPSNRGMVLMLVQQRDTPKMLGLLGSLGAVAAVAATGIVYFLAEPLGYRALFTLMGGLIIAGGVLLLPMGNGTGGGLPPKRRVVLRRRYWLYYIMAFLMGSRRHIFTTFAIFLLVQKYGINVQTTAILFLANSLINIFALRIAGHLVGRMGERLILSGVFVLLILVFLGYAYVSYLPLLFGLFILDNVLFGFNMALTTYFQKIAVDPEEITSNLSVEQTINHIAAIVVPILGGAIWELLGSQAPFLGGVGIMVISLILVQFMRTQAKPSRTATAPST